MDKLTRRQSYLIRALIRVLAHMNQHEGGTEKANNLLKSIVTDSINSLYARAKKENPGPVIKKVMQRAEQV